MAVEQYSSAKSGGRNLEGRVSKRRVVCDLLTANQILVEVHLMIC